MHPCTGRLTDLRSICLCWKPRWFWHTWAGASLKKSCTALKVHLYWPISTQISSASCGKNRNFRDSQQIAWLKKSSQVERLCSAKSKAVKRRASHLIWPVKARGIYIALFPCHGVLLFSCVFFFTTLQGRTKRKSKLRGRTGRWVVASRILYSTPYKSVLWCTLAIFGWWSTCAQFATKMASAAASCGRDWQTLVARQPEPNSDGKRVSWRLVGDFLKEPVGQ